MRLTAMKRCGRVISSSPVNPFDKSGRNMKLSFM